MKLWMPRQTWGTGVGDYLQILGVIPYWQRLNPGAEVVLAFQHVPNFEAVRNIPGVTYVETDSPPDRDFIDAFSASPGPPRSHWWERCGLDWNQKRFHYWLTEAERHYAEWVWGATRPRVIVQRRGGMYQKLYGSFDAIARFMADLGCNVIELDPHRNGRIYHPVRRGVNGRLRDTLALVATADLYIGWDSGPFYVALGSAVPGVALFPITDPQGLYWPVQTPHTIALNGIPDEIPPSDFVRDAIRLLSSHTETPWTMPEALELAERTFRNVRNVADGTYVDVPGTDYGHAWGDHESGLEKEFSCPESGVYYAVGAHVGKWVMHNARRGCRTVAFEPNPTTREVLARNLDLNGIRNVSIIGKALSDHQGTALLSDDIGHSSLHVAGELEVELDTLDNFASEENRIDLITIDTEGHENQVLAGAIRTIKRLRPRIVIESHSGFEHLGGNPAMLEATLDILESAGYKTRTLRKHPTPYLEAVPK